MCALWRGQKWRTPRSAAGRPRPPGAAGGGRASVRRTCRRFATLPAGGRRSNVATTAIPADLLTPPPVAAPDLLRLPAPVYGSPLIRMHLPSSQPPPAPASRLLTICWPLAGQVGNCGCCMISQLGNDNFDTRSRCLLTSHAPAAAAPAAAVAPAPGHHYLWWQLHRSAIRLDLAQ